AASYLMHREPKFDNISMIIPTINQVRSNLFDGLKKNTIISLRSRKSQRFYRTNMRTWIPTNGRIKDGIYRLTILTLRQLSTIGKSLLTVVVESQSLARSYNRWLLDYGKSFLNIQTSNLPNSQLAGWSDSRRGIISREGRNTVKLLV